MLYVTLDQDAEPTALRCWQLKTSACLPLAAHHSLPLPCFSCPAAASAQARASGTSFALAQALAQASTGASACALESQFPGNFGRRLLRLLHP